MIALVPARPRGLQVIRAGWVDHYGDAAGGALIAVVGLLVTSLGG